MAKFPAIPLYTDAYLADTRHLSAAQHGAYLLLLIMAWRCPDCALPNDDEILARWASMDLRTWKNNKSVILSFWHLNSAGKLQQSRLVDERKHADMRRNRNSDAGHVSALKRQERHSTDVQPKPNQKSTNPNPNIDTNVSITPISPKLEPTKVRRNAIPSTSLGEFIPDLNLPDGWADYPRREYGWSSERVASEWRGFVRYWTGPDAKGGGRKRDWKGTWENSCDRQAKFTGGSGQHGAATARQGSSGSRDIMAAAKHRVLVEHFGKQPPELGGETAYPRYTTSANAGIVGTAEAVTVDVKPYDGTLPGQAGTVAGIDSNADDGLQVANIRR